jgi:dienelactone hydrolase
MLRSILSMSIALTLLSAASAEVTTGTVVYQDGEVKLEGFVAFDPDKIARDAPGVLVVHQWMGLTDYEQRRCRELAELGFVAFALDIYGQGIRPANQGEAGQMAGKFKSDRKLYRQRLNLGLEQLKKMAHVDSNRLAAIGYCFGGTGVIELARSGANVAGVVSFHGGLDSPSPADAKNITAKILVQHGADDPFVPKADIEAFTAEMDSAKVDWQMDIYSGAVHSFTQPMAGNDNSKGAAYNEKADKRSWQSMKLFFQELFGSNLSFEPIEL